MTDDDLCFTARALAQTHPLTERASRYRQARFDEERARQPVPELADWASTALLVGYCLRRAEERAAGIDPTPGPTARSVDEISHTLRAGDAQSVTLLSAPTTLAALDRLIATELDKRQEHLREQLTDDDWQELEDYIAWWVVHGYGVRASECPKP